MSARETFSSRAALLLTMIGVAVGLGNVWRFPYMTGRFGGAAFVLFYIVLALLVGAPALMAEWTLGRHTRRGSVGAFLKAGVPWGRQLGWVFFFGVTVANGYYSAAIGWVLMHGFSEALSGAGIAFDAGQVLPPDTGFAAGRFTFQFLTTALILGTCGLVVTRGLRKGIQRASVVLTPLLFMVLVLVAIRSMTLDGAGEGLRWFLFKFDAGSLNAGVAMAALGQVVFSLALGGTFMVVYGSYLGDEVPLRANAVWTVAGDTLAGILAGLAIFPAVFALGLEPGSGPGLIFSTLPRVFDGMAGGWVFGSMFFFALAGAAFLSAVAAFEVLVAGLVDNTRLTRRSATFVMAGGSLLMAIPPMINLGVFVPWDLTFGTGFQTVGALLAAATVGWAITRSSALRSLAGEDASPWHVLLLYRWIRYVVPGAVLAVGIWWLLTDVLQVVASPG